MNIIMPEHHDLETMLFCSPALDRILREYGSQNKLAQFDENVLDALINRALPIGYLRMYSEQNSLGLKFQGIKYGPWIDLATFQVDTDKMIQEVLNHSMRHDLAAVILNNGITELANGNYDPREICNGDDLIGILLIGLRSKLGNCGSSAINDADLRRALRLAYAEEEFKASQLRRDIRSWEDQCGGFRVLP